MKIEQLVSVLMMREDISKSDARSRVEETLGKDHDMKPAKATILSKLYTVWQESKLSWEKHTGTTVYFVDSITAQYYILIIICVNIFITLR